MPTTHAAESATMSLIVSCLFVFRVVGFIIDDFFLKKKENIGPNMLTTYSNYLARNLTPDLGLLKWTSTL